MRKIRFKACSLRTGMAVEGYYCHQHIAMFASDGQTVLRYDEQDVIYNDEPGHRNGSHWTPIAPETLCQHTGTEDMNTKPIWEHDIVRLHSQSRPSRVKRDTYHGQEAEVIYQQGTFSLLLSDGNNMTLKRALGSYNLQVISNRVCAHEPVVVTRHKKFSL